MIIRSFILLCGIAFVLSSCSSDSQSSNKSSSQQLKKESSGKVVQVDFIDKKALKKQGLDPNSDKFEKALLNSGFGTKKVWYKMQEEYKEFVALKDKPTMELVGMMKGASAEKTTLLIEVLSTKGPTAVSALIDCLNDKRKCIFKEKEVIYWYEEKNKPPEDLEIRVFAAMHLEKMTNTSPYSVRFDFHNIKTDKGFVDILYAIKGSYAVTKDDVCKSWLKWWSVYGGDYK